MEAGCCASARSHGRPFIFIDAADGEQALMARQWQAGRAVTPDDTEGLVALLKSIDADRPQLAAMGANAARMLESWSSASAFARWGKLLAAVARQ